MKRINLICFIKSNELRITSNAKRRTRHVFTVYFYKFLGLDRMATYDLKIVIETGE